MYFHEVLNHAQGVMIFEGLENSRSTPPMTDKSGAGKYEANIKKQMMGLWDIMFPKSKEFYAEEEEKRETFKSHMKGGMYDKLKADLKKRKIGE